MRLSFRVINTFIDEVKTKYGGIDYGSIINISTNIFNRYGASRDYGSAMIHFLFRVINIIFSEDKELDFCSNAARYTHTLKSVCAKISKVVRTPVRVFIEARLMQINFT